MAGDELGESSSVELAAGSTEPRRKALGILEDVVRDRNGGFHTQSMNRMAFAHQYPWNASDQRLAIKGRTIPLQPVGGPRAGEIGGGN
ncbi:MAG: hypothetical protein WED27_10015 [Pirellulales bacterium]